MKTKLSRRDLLKSALATQTATLAGCASRRVGTAHHVDLEDLLPGTTDWMLTKTRIDPKTKYRCPWIEGYCSSASVRAGETVTFHVSTNPASRFKIDIYRLA